MSDYTHQVFNGRVVRKQARARALDGVGAPGRSLVLGADEGTRCATCGQPAGMELDGVAYCWTHAGIERWELPALNAYLEESGDDAEDTEAVVSLTGRGWRVIGGRA